jgi:hypothetical protein
LIQRGLFAVELHLYLALLGADHHRLLSQPPDHVKGFLGLTAQRQLLDVVGDAALDHGAQFLRDGEEPIRREQSLQRLVRTFVIVVFDPQPHPFACLLETVKLRPHQKVLPDRFPEPLDLAQRHRVMGRTADMVDAVFL